MTHEEIRDIAKRHFEEDPLLEATLLKGGLFNTTYKLTMPSAKRELILRVGPVNRELLMPFEHRLMEAECHVYEKMAARQIPCPTVAAVDFSKAYIDRDYMITEFIDSMPLSSEAVPDTSKGRLYEETGKWTAQLHEITGASFGRVSEIRSGNGYDNWGTYLAAHVAEIGEVCLRHEALDRSAVNRIVRLFDNNRELYKNITVPRLVHADLWAGNVLVSNENAGGYHVAAIIDADRAVYGDVDFEFASPWMINDAFLRGYGDFRQEPADQLKKDTYKLIYSLIDTYVWLVQFDNVAEHEKYKQRTLELLELIEKQV